MEKMMRNCHLKSLIFNHYFSSYMQLRNKLYFHFYKCNYVDFVKNYLDCSDQEAINSLARDEKLRKLTEDELNLRLNKIHRLGLTHGNKGDYISLVKHHPTTIKNRVMSMEECGFLPNKITTMTVKRYLSLTHMKVDVLKEMCFIENDTDVYQKLLKHAELIETDLPTSDETKLINIKELVLKLVLKKEIDMTDEILDKNVEILKRTKNKSIRLTRQNIKIARDILGISKARICRNPFLLWVDPENTLKLIEEIKELGGLDIKLCMALVPKMVASPFQKIHEIKICLKEYNMSDYSIQKALGIFTLSSDSVRSRLQELEKNERWTISRYHSRALQLVYYYNTIILRLRLLEEMKISNLSISSFSTTSQKLFDQYFEQGLIRQPGKDVTMYICNEFGCNKSDFWKKMKNCPFWRCVSPVQIIRNLKLLREKGFTDKEIFNFLHVLFYDNSKVIEELNSLNTKEGIDCCMENGTVKREFILPLVIYFIEKGTNFSNHSFCATDVTTTHTDIALPSDGNQLLKSSIS